MPILNIIVSVSLSFSHIERVKKNVSGALKHLVLGQKLQDSWYNEEWALVLGNLTHHPGAITTEE